jgi:hypothetical protein
VIQQLLYDSHELVETTKRQRKRQHMFPFSSTELDHNRSLHHLNSHFDDNSLRGYRVLRQLMDDDFVMFSNDLNKISYKRYKLLHILFLNDVIQHDHSRDHL